MAPKNDEPRSAWKKDQEIGNILGVEFSAEGEGSMFLLVAAKLTGEVVATKYGDAQQAGMLVRKLDVDRQPIGPVFEVKTVESAIVAKLSELTPDDVPAIVRYHTVASKQRGGSPAKVITYIGKPGESNEVDLLAAYDAPANATTDDLAGMGA
jgi:hypothetical protein